ncbi:MAG TPA: sulfotransferase [Fluviicoccus sp.]|nr:sulfotransferase [Fluviicoccus sp.]
MKKVNFFLLGAPKCGTTSMANYLGQHPEFFMPPMKEIHYFSTDLPKMARVTKPGEYDALYPFTDARYQYFGDASVYYLYSQEAIPRIVQYNPAAKFLVIARKPQAMVPSLHSQYVSSGRENIPDFREAWNARFDRKNGLRLSRNAGDQSMIYYDEIAKYGEQMERALRHIAPENLLFMDFDDFKQDSEGATRQVFRFLGIDPDVPLVMEVANANHRPKYPRLMHFLWYPPFPLNLIKRGLKSFMFIRKKMLLQGFYKRLTVYENRVGTPPDLEREILEVYQEDISLLEKVTGQDFSHWRRL